MHLQNLKRREDQGKQEKDIVSWCMCSIAVSKVSKLEVASRVTLPLTSAHMHPSIFLSFLCVSSVHLIFESSGFLSCTQPYLHTPHRHRDSRKSTGPLPFFLKKCQSNCPLCVLLTDNVRNEMRKDTRLPRAVTGNGSRPSTFHLCPSPAEG